MQFRTEYDFVKLLNVLHTLQIRETNTYNEAMKIYDERVIARTQKQEMLNMQYVQQLSEYNKLPWYVRLFKSEPYNKTLPKIKKPRRKYLNFITEQLTNINNIDTKMVLYEIQVNDLSTELYNLLKSPTKPKIRIQSKHNSHVDN